jgi:hypothetical protein
MRVLLLHGATASFLLVGGKPVRAPTKQPVGTLSGLASCLGPALYNSFTYYLKNRIRRG